MEQLTLILISSALLLLVIIAGLLTVLLIKVFKQGSTSHNEPTPLIEKKLVPDISKSDLHPAILERMKDAEKIRPKKLELFCPNHVDEPGEVTCSICDKLFCSSCIKPYKSLHFCKEHLPLIMRHEWDEVITVKTSTHDPENGVRLYEIKKEIFEREDLPTYIETHYKINIDQDHIETYLVMFSIKENVDQIKNLLQQIPLSSGESDPY